MEAPNFKTKSFWQKPEGITGLIFLAAIVLGGGYLIAANIGFLIGLMQNTLYVAGMIAVLGAVVYLSLIHI